MFVVIFGRPACPYCVRAKEHAETLKAKRDDFNYRYVDIQLKAFLKQTLRRQLANQLKLFLKSLSTKNTSVVVTISKLTRKST